MKQPRKCPRCGEMVGCVGGLYRCSRDGEFDPGRPKEKRHILSPKDADEERGNRPWSSIDGRAIPLDRRFK